MHDRFNRTVLATKDDFTGALAKWLIKQSPYVVPDCLSFCIKEFHVRLDEIADFDSLGMAEIELRGLAQKIFKVFDKIGAIKALNVPSNPSIKFDQHTPDSDFIDIHAVAQNIVCEFAEREDAQCWLDRDKVSQ
jgi:hypothetical protein